MLAECGIVIVRFSHNYNLELFINSEEKNSQLVLGSEVAKCLARNTELGWETQGPDNKERLRLRHLWIQASGQDT